MPGPPLGATVVTAVGDVLVLRRLRLRLGGLVSPGNPVDDVLAVLSLEGDGVALQALAHALGTPLYDRALVVRPVGCHLGCGQPAGEFVISDQCAPVQRLRGQPPDRPLEVVLEHRLRHVGVHLELWEHLPAVPCGRDDLAEPAL